MIHLETNKPFGRSLTTLDPVYTEENSDSFRQEQTHVLGMDLLFLPTGPLLAPLFKGL